MLRVAGRLGQCFTSVPGKCDMVRPSAAVRIELPERVTGGKTLSEYIFSELLLTADIGACSRGPELPEIMHWPIWFSSISIDLGI